MELYPFKEHDQDRARIVLVSQGARAKAGVKRLVVLKDVEEKKKLAKERAFPRSVVHPLFRWLYS